MFPFNEPEIIWLAGRRDLQTRLLRSLKRFVAQQCITGDTDTDLSRGTGGRV